MRLAAVISIMMTANWAHAGDCSAVADAIAQAGSVIDSATKAEAINNSSTLTDNLAGPIYAYFVRYTVERTFAKFPGEASDADVNRVQSIYLNTGGQYTQKEQKLFASSLIPSAYSIINRDIDKSKAIQRDIGSDRNNECDSRAVDDKLLALRNLDNEIIDIGTMLQEMAAGRSPTPAFLNFIFSYPDANLASIGQRVSNFALADREAIRREGVDIDRMLRKQNGVSVEDIKKNGVVGVPNSAAHRLCLSVFGLCR